jgi:molybdopterin synthase sulfur carrier subunit
MSASIAVQVDFYSTIREVFGDTSRQVTLRETPTVRSLLDTLCTFREAREKIFDDSGRLRDDISILKNGRKIVFLDGLDTELTNGDIIAIFPPMAGG